MTLEQAELKRVADQLYEEHGKPLEADHTGKYLAVARDGRTVLGDSLREVARQARTRFGPGSFLFRVGAKAVWNWR